MRISNENWLKDKGDAKTQIAGYQSRARETDSDVQGFWCKYMCGWR